MQGKILAILFVLMSTVASVNAQHTYYISSSSGSDGNTSAQAESNATPWAHLPGMAACTGSCASYKPVSGDRFILKGCDTWTASSFPITWSWSGTSGNNIYVGVDKTWYNTTTCASAWNRPVFTAGGATIAGTYNVFWRMASGADYNTIDNIEWTGQYWSGNPGYGDLEAITFQATDYNTFTNNYIHGWTHASGGDDAYVGILGDTNAPHCDHCTFEYNIIEDADGTNGGDSGEATYALGGTFAYNVIHDTSNGILLSGAAVVHDNYVYNINQSFDSTSHENGFEINGQDGPDYIYDNVFANLTAVSLFLGGFSYPVDLWNNVIYPGNNANSPQLEGRDGSWSGLFANNTIYDSKSQNCFVQVGSGPLSLTLANNHCISSAGLSTTAYSTQTNLIETPSAAVANTSPKFDDYTSAQKCMFAPVAATNSTVGAGTNLTSSWPSGYATSDTTCGCVVSTSNQVSCPARTPNARPTSGAWDIGAFEFGNKPAPAAPTALTGIVKSGS
ncbi:MAG TPA: hypothetical protein VHX13_14010 [Acidobacteriaceae bacterium]|jgi:hypothetical protein|nr:hypothetical protein [Acidobacteriaceae bacterium]